ncbi:MAG: peptide chain release factor 2 [Saprospiraceae bacterium]|nr:peptide chain release factor 2 [Saprospiraceae bacterium]
MFDIDKRLHEIEDKTNESLATDFWSNPEKAEATLKELKSHQTWVNKFRSGELSVEEAAVALELAKEDAMTEAEVDEVYRKSMEIIDDMEFKSTITKPEDELNAILEINAGAGGTEACDWASMLMRMYIMYAEKNGFKVTELSSTDGDVAGIKSVTLEIVGDLAYGLLKGENGVHRLVRVSPYNAQGKRMTSFASVFVHPMVDDRIEVIINPADLEWDTFRASGAGGQHVNRTESAVRVRHLPTGIVAECQQERSQIQNREKAMMLLKSRIYELELEKQRAEKDAVEASKMKNEWGSQIRSYVLDDRRVKDHRTGYTNNNTDAVLNGDISGFLKEFLLWDGSSASGNSD